MKHFVLYISFFISLNSLAKDLRITKIADLPNKLYETSGLALFDFNYLITHNDGGNKSEIYVLNLKGELIKTIDVDEAKNIDWEDLTRDKSGKLYIGDFGNNLNNREKNAVYILRSGFLQDKNDRINADKISFTYEDQNKFPPKKENLNYDAEAFFWKNDSLYILTKCRSKPFTGTSYIYVIPAKPGKYKAKKIGKLQFCKSNWQWCSVTSADYSFARNELTVLTYSKMHVFSDFTGNQFWNGKRVTYNLPTVKQREAICYAGKNKWYMTDEYRRGIGGGNLYKVELK